MIEKRRFGFYPKEKERREREREERIGRSLLIVQVEVYGGKESII